MHVSFSLNGTAHVAKENKPTIVSDIVDFFLSSVGATLTHILFYFQLHFSFSLNGTSDFIWPFLPPYMGVIPNPKMAFIFPISCIFALVFPIFMKYFPKCSEKGSVPKSQIKSLGTAHVAKENKPTIVSDIVDFFLSSVGATLTDILFYFQLYVSFSLNGAAHVAKENKPTIVSDILDFFLSFVGATLTHILFYFQFMLVSLLMVQPM